MLKFQFSKLFAKIPVDKKIFLDKPINSKTMARNIANNYKSVLNDGQISNLMEGLPYFNVDDMIMILKKQLKVKQRFGHDQFKEQLLQNNALDNTQMANILYVCYKFNLSEELWAKCLSINVNSLGPYYLSEVMWALKHKQFQNNENQQMSLSIQQQIKEILQVKLDQFDFYCLSLIMQSLPRDYNWDPIVKRWVTLSNLTDKYSLIYGLHSIAKNTTQLDISLPFLNQIEFHTVKQQDLLLLLWAMLKLHQGDETFWKAVHKHLQAIKIRSLADLALQSQILSKLFVVEDTEWVELENKIKLFWNKQADEKSLVTLFQTFIIHRKNSENFINELKQQILIKMSSFTQKSLIQLAIHSEDKEFTKKLPLIIQDIPQNHKCLLFHQFCKLNINVDKLYQSISPEYLKPRDLVLVIRALYQYQPNYPKQQYLQQLQKNINQLNLLDIQQLFDLVELPKDIYESIVTVHSKDFNQKLINQCKTLGLTVQISFLNQKQQ